MTLPSFNAEQSLYRSSRHYRASALAGAVGGIRPADGPPGSYQQSCDYVNCRWDIFTDVLSCDCLDFCGGFRFGPPLLNAGACQNEGNDIANCNGFLKCGSC
jgi:hypothetical protein